MKKMLKKHTCLFIILTAFLSFLSINESLAADGVYSPHGDTGMGYSDQIKAEYKELKREHCTPAFKMSQEAKSSCTLCSVFELVFNAVSVVGAKSVNAFSGGVAKAVIIGFAIWLAIQIIAFASSIETQDIKDLLQKMLTQGFIVMIVVIILDGGAGIFMNKFLAPVYNVAHIMSRSILADNTQNTAALGDLGATKIAKIPNGLPQTMGVNIIKTMTALENKVRQVKVMGSSFICMSFFNFSILALFTRMFWVGAAMWLFGLILIISIPILLIDSVLKLGVVIATLPLAIGGYAFKYTRQYTKKVWDTLLNSSFSFLFIVLTAILIIGCVGVTVEESVKETLPEGASFSSMFETGNKAGEAMFVALSDGLDGTADPLIKMLLIFVLAWSVIQMGKDMGGDFSSSISNTAIGSDIGTSAASMAKGFALKAGKPAGGLLWSKAKSGVSSAITSIKSSRFSSRQEKKMNKMTSGGNANVVRKNGVVVADNYTSNNQRVKTLDTKNMSLTIIYNPDGSYTQKLKLNKDMLKKVINSKGGYSKAGLEAMLEGTSGSEREQLHLALMDEINQKRISEYAINYSKQKWKSPATVLTNRNGETLTRRTNDKGQTIFTKVKEHPNGFLETQTTIIDKNGNVKVMTSDGIYNKIEKFTLKEGTDVNTLNSISAIFNSADSSKKHSVGWAYGKHYQEKVNRTNMPSGIFAGESEDIKNFMKSSGNEFLRNDLRSHFK